MMVKNLLLPLLFFSLILLLVIDCGVTEDERQQGIEDLAGHWGFVSFGEQSVDETINAFFNQTGVDGVKIDATTSSLIFQQDGSWSREIGGEFVGDLNNLIEEVTLVPQGVNVGVNPQYFWELVGTTEADFAREFRSEVFGKIYAFRWTVQDDKLILTEAESGEKTIVRKE